MTLGTRIVLLLMAKLVAEIRVNDTEVFKSGLSGSAESQWERSYRLDRFKDRKTKAIVGEENITLRGKAD